MIDRRRPLSIRACADTLEPAGARVERKERQHEAKLAALRVAIDEGDASGIAKGNVFGRVRKTLKLPASLK